MSRCAQKQALRHCSSLRSSQRTCAIIPQRLLHSSVLSHSFSTPRPSLIHPTYLTRLFSSTSTAATTTAPSSAAPTAFHAAASQSSSADASSATREVKVVSYYLSPLDLVHLSYPTTTLKFTRPACTLVSLSGSGGSGGTVAAVGLSASTFDVYSSYAIVFDYGAIVFFNATEAQQQAFLPTHLHRTTTATTATTTTTTALPTAVTAASSTTGAGASLRLKDDYNVIVDPLLTTHHPNTASSSFSSSNSAAALTCAFRTDSVHVSALDIYSVRVIAQILAQTISMEYYEHKTSSMLAEFHSLSLHMSATGTLPASLTSSSSSNLIKLLAQNNTILTTILTHIRLLDRSEISWRYGQYDALWEGMRTEFSIEDRYETLETKLRLLHENHPLFLEVLHHKQGHRMELIIIYLIAIEVILAIVFHSPIVGWIVEQLGLAEKGKIKTYD